MSSNISDIVIVPLPDDSPFVKPLRLEFSQDGRKRKWDLVRVHDSVSIIIFNVTRKVLIFVKQFRPAVFYNIVSDVDKIDHIDVSKYPAHSGYTLELCAGIVDKDKSLSVIAAEEIQEECGYKINPNMLENIIKFRSGVGISGELQHMFYVEVTDEMRVDSGGGNKDEDEYIEVVEMSINQVKSLLSQTYVASPAGFLFAVQWFLAKKASNYV